MTTPNPASVAKRRTPLEYAAMNVSEAVFELRVKAEEADRLNLDIPPNMVLEEVEHIERTIVGLERKIADFPEPKAEVVAWRLIKHGLVMYTEDSAYKAKMELEGYTAKSLTYADAGQSAWRPIAEAPRDGTRILGWSAKYGFGETRWVSSEGTISAQQGIPGWFEWHEPKSGWVFQWEDINYWMPLPQPPNGNE